MARRTEFRDGSLASQILDAGDEPAEQARRTRHKLATRREPPVGSPARLVVHDRLSRNNTVAMWAGVAVAAVLHAGAFGFAYSSAVRPRTQPETARPIEVQHIVELTPPEPVAEPGEKTAPEPAESEATTPPQPEAAPVENTSPPDASPAESEPAESEPAESEPAESEPAESPPAPAQAGDVMAAESDSPQIADFTDFDITTGDAESYAGGVTAHSGSNSSAVHSKNVNRDAPPARTGDPTTQSGARPVGLSQRDWKCPWPRKADQLSRNAQTVVLRAVVAPDGSAQSVTLVSDPGFGFGKAALACARSHRFEPARDEDGTPYLATSPPIHVEFER